MLFKDSKLHIIYVKKDKYCWKLEAATWYMLRKINVVES